jgi:hypothetical protein
MRNDQMTVGKMILALCIGGAIPLLGCWLLILLT